jgi:hypothetical protein
MRRLYLVAAIAFSFHAQAQVGWQVTVDNAQPFAAREPLSIDLTTGDVAILSEAGGITCTSSNGPCPAPDASTPRPYYFVIDGKWYRANLGTLDFYRGVFVADQVQLPSCVRPGGIGQTVTQNILLSNSGIQLVYLSPTALIEQKQGTRVSDGIAISYMVFRTASGDVTCAGAIPSPLLGDNVFKNGYEGQ